jgi:hypothetical protein
MLDDYQSALARAQRGLIEAQQQLDTENAKIEKLKSVGRDTREAQQTLNFLDIYVSILERHRDTLFAMAARKHNQPYRA